MGTALADEGIVAAVLDPAAMVARGALWVGLEDGLAEGTLVLLGWTGGAQWPVFAASAEYGDGAPDPLDRWTRRLLDGAAAALGARALYPGEGPPFWPFQRWAMRAEGLAQSPLGLLIHPEWGLWHAWRGALWLPRRLELVDTPDRPVPCDGCARPCLGACPVAAFQPGAYDTAACATHLAAPTSHCPTQGCAARRACPVTPPIPYGPAQMRFHIAALAKGLRRHQPSRPSRPPSSS